MLSHGQLKYAFLASWNLGEFCFQKMLWSTNSHTYVCIFLVPFITDLSGCGTLSKFKPTTLSNLLLPLWKSVWVCAFSPRLLCVMLAFFTLCTRVKQKLSYCVSWKQIPEAGKNSASSYFDKYIRNINGVERSFPTSLHIFDHWS